MNALLLHLHVTYRIAALNLRERLADDQGEGVVSTAIAVLIVALLGAAMWVAFRQMFDGAAAKASGAVNSIGG
jgi:hypothetical protein